MTVADEDSRLLVDDALIVRYLRDNPDFFARHPRLLAELELPHDAGDAVSLVEKQVALLRQRNMDARRRLNQLLLTAADNDALFAKTRKLTLALLDVDGLESLDAVLAQALAGEFQADDVCCYLSVAAPGCRHVVGVTAVADIPLFARTGDGPLLSPLSEDEYEAVFHLRTGGSAAMTRLEGERGMLAIGSRLPERFTPEMGTLFVDYIGAVLARVVARLTAR